MDLKAAAFLMTGLVEDFTVAVDVEGQSTPVSTLMNLQNGQTASSLRLPGEEHREDVRDRQAALSGRAHDADQRHSRLRAGVAHSGIQEARYAATRAGPLSDSERVAFLHEGLGSDGKRLD